MKTDFSSAKENKMILIISAVFPPEPVVSARLSLDIADNLSQTNRVTVLSPKPTRPYGFHFEEKSVGHHPFVHIVANSYICPELKFIGRLRESYSFGKYCQKFICENKNKISAIYANTWPLFGQFFAVKAAKKHHIPIIIHVQDIYPESLFNKIPYFKKILTAFLLPIDKYILKQAAHIIAISGNMKLHLAQTRNINQQKITVINNWQDESLFVHYRNSKTVKQSDTRFTFMYLGNIGPVAGVDLLINAFCQIQPVQNTRLVIAGSGSMKDSLQQKCEKLKIENIEFWSVPDGKVPEIQDYADVLLLPIKKGAAHSSIPSKLPAYMFSAKPIIACVDDESDTANSIGSANCGWIVPPENVSMLSTKLQEVINLPKSELVQKGENGRNYALRNLSKKENLNKLVSIIRESNANTN